MALLPNTVHQSTGHQSDLQPLLGETHCPFYLGVIILVRPRPRSPEQAVLSDDLPDIHYTVLLLHFGICSRGIRLKETGHRCEALLTENSPCRSQFLGLYPSRSRNECTVSHYKSSDRFLDGAGSIPLAKPRNSVTLLALMDDCYQSKSGYS